MKKPDPDNRAAQRRSQQPGNSLNSETQEWLETLPLSVRPQTLAKDFGRIVNALRTTWHRPEVCLEYFEDLLIDRRGDRRGFPAEVAMEIAALKDYYQTAVFVSGQTVWDQISQTRH